MSETATHRKTETHSETTAPVILRDHALDTVAGGAPSHSQCEPDDSGRSKPKPPRRSSGAAGLDVVVAAASTY